MCMIFKILYACVSLQAAGDLVLKKLNLSAAVPDNAVVYMVIIKFHFAVHHKPGDKVVKIRF